MAAGDFLIFSPDKPSPVKLQLRGVHITSTAVHSKAACVLPEVTLRGSPITRLNRAAGWCLYRKPAPFAIAAALVSFRPTR